MTFKIFYVNIHCRQSVIFMLRVLATVRHDNTAQRVWQTFKTQELKYFIIYIIGVLLSRSLVILL